MQTAEEDTMNTTTSFGAGLGLGAGLTYLVERQGQTRLQAAQGGGMEEMLRTSEETLTRMGRTLLEDELSANSRVAFTAVGGTLIAIGTSQRAPLACVLGSIGIGFMLRGISNLPFSRLLGMGGGHHDMDVEKMSQSSQKAGSQNPVPHHNGAHYGENTPWRQPTTAAK
jgi:hypothetical protein